MEEPAEVRLWNVLVRDTPIILFSTETYSNIDTINNLGEQILKALDETFGNGPYQPNHQGPQSLFWLWVLGSYEISRTMCQARSCFTPELHSNIWSFKKYVSPIRIVFAKQEYERECRAVEEEYYDVDFHKQKRDIIYVIRSKRYSIRASILRFNNLINSIKQEDIIKPHSDDDKYQDGLR